MAKVRPASPKSKVKAYEPAPKQRVQQSFRDETDINRIVARYTLTGTLPPEHSRAGTYLDVSSVDFLQAQNLVADIRSRFDRYPSKLRSKFANSPHQMLRWLEDPENHAEAVRLGILPESYLKPDLEAQKAAQRSAKVRERVEQLDIEEEAQKGRKGGESK